MKLVKGISFILISTFSYFLVSWNQKLISKKTSHIKKYYNQFDVKGCFILYDQTNDTYFYYNHKQCNKQYSPASTFKICNSLIGLETGVIKNENYTLQWDSVIRPNSNWNKSQDLQSAYSYSTVWYYQELARRVGRQEMNYWLTQLKYGNQDTSGGIDQFWLTGGLRISAKQQISFLQNLQNYQLPVSQRTIDIVKKIMIEKKTDNYILRSKTGWGYQDNEDIGWYIGYIEKNHNIYYFANCIQSKANNLSNFGKARIEITMSILNDLNIISANE